MLLTGEYTNKVDDKGRVLIPAKLRSLLLSNSVVATKGLDGACIALFPPDYFNKTFSFAISGDDGMGIFSSAGRMFTRRFLSSSQPLDFDSAGRLNLPQSLRSYAGVATRSEVTILGMGSYIEIWDTAAYEKFMAESEEGMTIAELGESVLKTQKGGV